MPRRTPSLAEFAYDTLQKHFQCMRSHEPGVRLGKDPEELHDMRVALRRMRATMKTLQMALPKNPARILAREMRWLAQSLGKVRDLDVFLDQLDKDIAGMAHAHAPALMKYRHSVARRRETLRKRMLRTLDSKRYRKLLERCEAFLMARESGKNGHKSAKKAGKRLIRKQLKQLLRLPTDALALNDEALHRLRIRVKRLRYTCQCFQGLYGRPLRELVRSLAGLQDALGVYNDCVVALAHTAEADPHEVAALRAIQFQRKAQLRRAALAMWSDFAQRETRRAFERALKGTARTA